MGYLDIDNETDEVSSSGVPIFNYTSNGEMNVINVGFRWFLADFINLHFGAARTELNPHMKTSGSLDLGRNEVVQENTKYYGVGIGMTFSRLQLFFDYTEMPNADGDQMKLNHLGVRLFFK